MSFFEDVFLFKCQNKCFLWTTALVLWFIAWPFLCREERKKKTASNCLPLFFYHPVLLIGCLIRKSSVISSQVISVSLSTELAKIQNNQNKVFSKIHMLTETSGSKTSPQEKSDNILLLSFCSTVVKSFFSGLMVGLLEVSYLWRGVIKLSSGNFSFLPQNKNRPASLKTPCRFQRGECVCVCVFVLWHTCDLPQVLPPKSIELWIGFSALKPWTQMKWKIQRHHCCGNILFLSCRTQYSLRMFM